MSAPPVVQERKNGRSHRSPLNLQKYLEIHPPRKNPAIGSHPHLLQNRCQLEGDLQSLIVGAWQHTHIDDGQGYEPVSQDMRFVIPSAGRMLYCQHVPGITDHAENAADITWKDKTILLPGPPAGYTVTFWSEDTMIWENEILSSCYLLERR